MEPRELAGALNRIDKLDEKVSFLEWCHDLDRRIHRAVRELADKHRLAAKLALVEGIHSEFKSIGGSGSLETGPAARELCGLLDTNDLAQRLAAEENLRFTFECWASVVKSDQEIGASLRHVSRDNSAASRQTGRWDASFGSSAATSNSLQGICVTRFISQAS